MVFEIIQTDSGNELEYMTKGLDHNDYIFRRDTWEYEMQENESTFYKLWFNSIGTIVTGKKSDSYFAINDGGDNEIGYIDDMADKKDMFGAKVRDKIFICKRDANKFLIIHDNKVIACVKRYLVDGMDNYLIYCRDEEHLRVIMLITLYIDLEWYSEERTEVLESISDKGLLDEIGGYKLPFLAKHKAWGEFDAESKKYSKCKDMGSN